MSDSNSLNELKKSLWDYLPAQNGGEKEVLWNEILHLIKIRKHKNKINSIIIIILLILILIGLTLWWFGSLEKNIVVEGYRSKVESLVNATISGIIAFWAFFGISRKSVRKKSFKKILKRDIDIVSYGLVNQIMNENSIKINKIVPLICGAFSLLFALLIFLK